MEQTPSVIPPQPRTPPNDIVIGNNPFLLEAKNPPPYPLSAIDIRYEKDDVALIHHIVQAYESGKKMPADVAKSVMCRVVNSEQSGYGYESGSPPELPWPDSSYDEPRENAVVSFWEKDSDKNRRYLGLSRIYKSNDYYIISPGETKTFGSRGLQNLHEVIDINELLTASVESFRTMEPAAQDEFIAWVFTDLVDKVVDLGDLDEIILPRIFEAIDRSPQRSKLFLHPLEYVQSHQEAYHYQLLLEENDQPYIPVSHVEVVALTAHWSDFQSDTMKYIARIESDQEARRLLGIFIDNTSFVDTLNTVRKLIGDGQNSVYKPQLERIGRMLFGFPPDDTSKNFHTGLGSFYNSVDLNKMEHLNAATEFDLKVMADMIQEYNVGDDLKIVLGCGKGRHTNPLAKMGIRGLVGVDIVEDEVQEAKSADATGSVIYHTADWNHLDFLPDGSVGFISNVGRNLTHVEKKKYFKTAVKEISRILKKGGVALIDLPDNNSGVYRDFRVRLMGILQSLGFPFDKFATQEEALSHIEQTVDNPFPQNPQSADWMNRYVPSERTIDEVFREYGLNVVKTVRQEIKGWGGAENVYYVAQKI